MIQRTRLTFNFRSSSFDYAKLTCLALIFQASRRIQARTSFRNKLASLFSRAFSYAAYSRTNDWFFFNFTTSAETEVSLKLSCTKFSELFDWALAVSRRYLQASLNYSINRSFYKLEQTMAWTRSAMAFSRTFFSHRLWPNSASQQNWMSFISFQCSLWIISCFLLGIVLRLTLMFAAASVGTTDAFNIFKLWRELRYGTADAVTFRTQSNSDVSET